MKKKRVSMDKIREILRLHEELNLSLRNVAAALSISKTAVCPAPVRIYAVRLGMFTTLPSNTSGMPLPTWLHLLTYKATLWMNQGIFFFPL